jgi:hypothetical protein
MQRIFLLRAYGDFVIAIQAIAKSDKKIQIVASDHLAPLYHALLAAGAVPPLSIEFIALGIQNGQLNFFTNKHLLSWATWKQLRFLKAYVKANPNHLGIDYIEQDIRRTTLNVIVGHKFKAVVPAGENVYQAYAHWLKLDHQPLIDEINQQQSINDVLAIPDARLQKRVIQPTLLAALNKYTHCNGLELKIARFNFKIDPTDLVYHNFDQLIQYMFSADFIICTDSLPAHLAYLLKKPHYIFYPKQGMKNFFTPYAIVNNRIGHFEQTDFRFLNNYIES